MAVGTTIFRAMSKGMNAVAVPLLDSPARRLVSPWFMLLTYTGRRSGRTFTLPVVYRRTGDEVHIAVALPDAKQWWRNFQGDGAPVDLRIGGTDHHGHGVATRDGKGGVSVTVTLDA